MDILASVGDESDLSRRNLRGLIEEDLIRQYTTQLKSFKKSSTGWKCSSEYQLVVEYNDLMKQINDTIDNSKGLKNDISNLEKRKANWNQRIFW